ncbi:hypothetical protein WJX73_007574 [Symbiochloris irregularis]|uniref:Uncharacterized protein n=1 Tax=Symbiochloris irregularis TaxID=706552 RepID=A0AAW1NQ75_9CHLO
MPVAERPRKPALPAGSWSIRFVHWFAGVIKAAEFEILVLASVSILLYLLASMQLLPLGGSPQRAATEL